MIVCKHAMMTSTGFKTKIIKKSNYKLSKIIPVQSNWMTLPLLQP